MVVSPAHLRGLAPLELATVGSMAFVRTTESLHVMHFDDVPGMHL